MDASTAGAILSAITLAVVGYQVYLMVRQTKIMGDQLTLARRQDEIVALQLTRHPAPVLTHDPVGGNPHGKYATATFRVVNRGTRGIREFWTYVRFPQEANGLGWYAHAAHHETHSVTVDGRNYLEIRALTKQPIYPRFDLKIGDMSFERVHLVQGIRVYWKVISEDGMFPPEEDHYERLDMKIDQ
jgi:hypothetical protein